MIHLISKPKYTKSVAPKIGIEVSSKTGGETDYG
jgi:hypothetical protein